MSRIISLLLNMMIIPNIIHIQGHRNMFDYSTVYEQYIIWVSFQLWFPYWRWYALLSCTKQHSKTHNKIFTVEYGVHTHSHYHSNAGTHKYSVTVLYVRNKFWKGIFSCGMSFSTVTIVLHITSCLLNILFIYSPLLKNWITFPYIERNC